MRMWKGIDSKHNDNLKFELTAREYESYLKFKEECDIKIDAQQARADADRNPDLDEDYYTSRSTGTRAHYSFLFTPSHIGGSVTVICNYLGIKKDITDYDSW